MRSGYGVHTSFRAVACLLISFALAVSFVPADAWAFGGAKTTGLQEQGAYIAESVDQMTSSGNYADNQILVTLESGASLKDVSNLDSVESASFIDEGEFIAMADIHEGSSVADALTEALHNPDVKAAQPNYTYRLLSASEQYKPNDPALSSSNPHTSTAGVITSGSAFNAWHLYSAKAFQAWGVARDCKRDPVTVAVLDTGCNVDHEDLASVVVSEYAWNAVSGKKMVADADTELAHGTHVCGIVGAEANNGKGTAGSGFGAKVLPVGVFGRNASGELVASTDAVVKAYNYVMECNSLDPSLNVKVINMSLGGYDESGEGDPVFEGIIQTAKDKGIATVCAAGNKGKSTYCFPSDFQNTVSVTALSEDGATPATYSDFNANKDICAPGSFLFSTCGIGGSGTYKVLKGTSQAAPMVSGTLAIMFSIDRTLSPDAAKVVLKSSTRKTGFDDSKHRGLYGSGLLDMASAISDTLSLSRANLSSASIGLSSESFEYNGRVQKPSVSHVVIGSMVFPGSAFDVKYANANSKNAGTYHLTVTGNFPGSKTVAYRILPKKAKPKVLLSFKDVVYSGNIKKPTVKSVKVGSARLQSSSYEIKYMNPKSKKVGKYSVSIALKGNYTGTMKCTYRIVPQKVRIKGVSSTSHGALIRWSKASGAGAYQVRIASNASMHRAKTKLVHGYGNTSCRISGLSSSKRRYVQVRACKSVNSKRFYGSWSAIRIIAG